VRTGPLVGYYVHHQGRGHAHRALSIASASTLAITALSSGVRPQGWTGDWVSLPDDAGAHRDSDLDAGDRLHYVPLGHPGLRSRMAAVSSWIETHRPDLMVVDVSVEIALLARLHGVGVVTMAMPGQRLDPAHRLGYDISTAITAPWPELAGPLWGGPPEDLAKAVYLGAISRFAPVSKPVDVSRTVVVLNGTGGAGPTPQQVRQAADATPGWDWVHLDRDHGLWVDDPWPLLCSAAVVVSHAGQNAVAEIAAARRPAILIPQDRPHDEQRTLAEALTALDDSPALVRPSWPAAVYWPELLDRATRLDGVRWAVWNDGHGAERAAAALAELVGSSRASIGLVPATPPASDRLAASA